jgi:DmsE family decaheme c-type cytochrome
MKSTIQLVTSLLFLILPLISFSQTKEDKFWSKLNPAFAEAEFVMDKEACVNCHEEYIEAYEKTIHSRLFENNPQKRLEAANCEACHGPRSIHIEEPDDRFAFTIDQYSEVCQQCHQDGQRLYWHNSMHKTADVGCVSCHNVMEGRSNSALLSKQNQSALCSECHTDVKAEMLRASHHPVQEGNLECSSCHNVHGTPGRGMLVKATINETCNSCHQEKRGPFIWEHPPVREDCLTCHVPHGSNNRSLLITQNATLCINCHQYGGHINQYRYNRVSTPYGNGCVNCHIGLHGSNHPSGAKFNR